MLEAVGEGVNHQLNVTQRIKDRAGSAGGHISRTLALTSLGVPLAVMRRTSSSGTRGMAALTCSLVAGQPKNGLDLRHNLRVDAAGLGDVGLLGQVLRQQLLGAVDRGLAIFVHRADDELRPVDVIDAAAAQAAPISRRFMASMLYSGGTQ